MADRSFTNVQYLGGSRKKVGGRFSPNGAGAIAADPLWLGFTVARTGVGQYTITLTDPYVAIVAFRADLQMNAVADLKLQWGAIDVVSAKTLVLNALAVAVPTEIAANANNTISFELTLRNTTVTP